MLASSGKKEGIRFSHNKWIFFTVMSIITGAISGLYDKHLMGHLDVMTVQVWFNIYQCLLMIPILLLFWFPHRKKTTPFVWNWNIVLISIFLCIADWIYFYALTYPDSMISVVSMVRRSNVVVTFAAGAIFFHASVGTGHDCQFLVHHFPSSWSISFCRQRGKSFIFLWQAISSVYIRPMQ